MSALYVTVKPLPLPEFKKARSAPFAAQGCESPHFLGAALKRRFVFIAAILFFSLPCLANAASFTVSLDRNTVTLGESATLTMTFEGGAPNGLPTLPTVSNLRIVDAGGEFTKMTYIQGQVSSTRSHTFNVVPAQPGDFTIPSISAIINGQTLYSQPVKLTVLKQDAPDAAPKTAFIKLVVPKTEVYLGEILPVEIQLFAQAGKITEAPQFKEEGFTLGKMAPATQSTTILNGQQYYVVTFKTCVTPAKVGKLNLGPATAGVTIPRPNSRRSIFGELMEWQSITLQSEPQPLEVLPLPKENAPPAFNGAVGNYSLSVTASPTNVAVGDPITVTIQIAGRGALDSITLPAQTNWQQFKLYPPTSDLQPMDNDPLGITGAKIFKLTAVPMSMDVRELPPFTFSFFDPSQKSYQTLVQPATPLIVRPSAASLPPPSIANAADTHDNGPAAADIVHIKPRFGMAAQIQPALIQQPWFVALQGIPILAGLSLLITRTQKEKLAGNPRLRRRREVDQTVRQGLKDLRDSAAASQPDAFFATLFHLLQERLGERLDLPASAITEAVLDERLRPLDVPEDMFVRLRELFHACNQARYARQDTNEELTSMIPDVESALNELRKLPG